MGIGEALVWSLNGGQVAAISVDTRGGIWIIDTQSGDRRNLLDDQLGSYQSIDWSPCKPLISVHFTDYAKSTILTRDCFVDFQI